MGRRPNRRFRRDHQKRAAAHAAAFRHNRQNRRRRGPRPAAEEDDCEDFVERSENALCACVRGPALGAGREAC